MARPVVIVNFKAYREATGSTAVTLAQHCEAAAQEHNADIRLAVQTADIFRVTQSTTLPIYAQHNDPTEPGQHTGWDTPNAIRAAGARGAFLNHYEHQIKNEDIIVAVRLLAKEKIESIVFCATVQQIKLLEKHCTPTYFCIEPHELIAGEVSVSHAKPDLVKNAVLATRIPVLVGAGVKDYDDIRIATELGAVGVVLASGIVLANHRPKAFKKLLTAHA